jgi:hypothetical protein
MVHDVPNIGCVFDDLDAIYSSACVNPTYVTLVDFGKFQAVASGHIFFAAATRRVSLLISS